PGEGEGAEGEGAGARPVDVVADHGPRRELRERGIRLGETAAPRRGDPQRLADPDEALTAAHPREGSRGIGRGEVTEQVPRVGDGPGPGDEGSRRGAREIGRHHRLVYPVGGRSASFLIRG